MTTKLPFVSRFLALAESVGCHRLMGWAVLTPELLPKQKPDC